MSARAVFAMATAFVLGSCAGQSHRAAGDGTTRGSSRGGATRLVIALRRAVPGRSASRGYRLACDPARGNVPHPGKACAVLARPGEPFAPVPRRTICSDIVLGEQEATVTGLFRGRRIRAVFTLRGSCEIARWSRLRDVVPGF